MRTFAYLCRSYPCPGSIAMIAFRHPSLFCVSFGSSWCCLRSLRTRSNHLSLGLPRGLFPPTFIVVTCLATFVSSLLITWPYHERRFSPRHKHWPAGPAHFSDRRTSSGQYILSVTGPYGPPRYMSGHQISNSAGPNDDNSQCVFFARSPVPHLGGFRAALLLQRDASVSRVRVWHVNQTH